MNNSIDGYHRSAPEPALVALSRLESFEENLVVQTPIESEAVQKQLARILSSPSFINSARFTRFLRFTVEETLAGNKDRIKAFSIAMSVFDRDERFNPQTDTIVRVEARRLRQKLGDYYTQYGKDDPVVIAIPRGSYSASFYPNPLSRTRLTLGVANDDRSVQSSPASTPVVAIVPLESLNSSLSTSVLAEGLTEDITTDLSRVPGLMVISHRSSASFGGRNVDPALVGISLGATHLLMGTFQIEEPWARIHVRLVEAASSLQLWAECFDCPLDHLLESQRKIAQETCSALSATFQLSGHSGASASGVWSAEARMLCRQAENLYNPPSDQARIAATALLYQSVVEIEPAWAIGYAGHAYIRAIGVWFNPAPIEKTELSKIEGLVDKALHLDPHEPRGLVAKGIANMLRGEQECALLSCQEAAEIAPSDSLAHAWCGMMTTYTGSAVIGIKPLQTAIRLNPADPRAPYVNMLGATYFHCGEHEKADEALRLNISLGGEFGPHMLAYIAANNHCLGKRHEASEAFRELRKAESTFSIEKWLRRAFRNSVGVENVLRPLNYIAEMST